jgi:nucleotide-binding universal stress UspA family protein
MRYGKILHPTDYSEESRPALLEACELAREKGATLVLLHVVETLGPEKLTEGEAAKRQPEAYRRRLWDEIHHVLPPDPHIHVEYVLSEESLVTAILRTAAERGCDLIVMATQGLTGWRRWLTGSVAEEVVRRASCPVLVIKPPAPPQPLGPLEADDLHPGRLIEEESQGPI